MREEPNWAKLEPKFPDNLYYKVATCITNNVLTLVVKKKKLFKN